MAMPSFQRSYSWDKDEAADLLSDLAFAQENDQAHFLGAIVLVRDDKRFLIVDGQQRLTTLTMILAALRDLETDTARSDTLHALIADENNDVVDQPTLWRISLNHIDGAFFRELVQKRGAAAHRDIDPNDSDSQKRMFNNMEYLFKELEKLGLEARRELSETIQERLLMVRVVVEDWDGGYNVFRVLNTRGKAPNSHDIIKTDLLQRSGLSIEEANHFSRQWAEHEARLGGSGLDDLLNQIRLLYSRNSSVGPSGFRKAVLNRTDARTFLTTELPAYVDAYVAISTGEVDYGRHSAAIKIALNHLRLLDHHIWRAPALRFLVHCKGDANTALAFFTRLERVAFAMMLVITDRKQRVKRYGRISDLADQHKVLLSNKGPFNLSKDEQRRMRLRLMGRFGSFGQRRAVALRLNAAIEGGRPLGPNDDATVEHVLPRNLPSESAWHTSWPNPSVQRELCDTIGNFVILTDADNRKADNHDFETKKALYFKNGEAEFALTRDLQDQIAWTPEIVRRRTQQLANILSAAWGLAE